MSRYPDNLHEHVPRDPTSESAKPAKPPKHKYWGAGEVDCPRDIKAGNGELHSLRCKVCGETNPPDAFCWNAAPQPQAAAMAGLLERLRRWDMWPHVSDGRYWTGEIDAVLAAWKGNTK